MISQLLESIYSILIFHLKRWGCANCSSSLVQSEKAEAVFHCDVISNFPTPPWISNKPEIDEEEVSSILPTTLYDGKQVHEFVIIKQEE